MLKTVSSTRPAHVSDPGYQSHRPLNTTQLNMAPVTPWECTLLFVKLSLTNSALLLSFVKPFNGTHLTMNRLSVKWVL